MVQSFGCQLVAKLRRRLVELGLLAALGHRNKRVIFQNDSDLDLFVAGLALDDDLKSFLALVSILVIMHRLQCQRRHGLSNGC